MSDHDCSRHLEPPLDPPGEPYSLAPCADCDRTYLVDKMTRCARCDDLHVCDECWGAHMTLTDLARNGTVTERGLARDALYLRGVLGAVLVLAQSVQFGEATRREIARLCEEALR